VQRLFSEGHLHASQLKIEPMFSSGAAFTDCVHS
jgi:hypothetical protein